MGMKPFSDMSFNEMCELEGKYSVLVGRPRVPRPGVRTPGDTWPPEARRILLGNGKKDATGKTTTPLVRKGAQQASRPSRPKRTAAPRHATEVHSVKG
jgi:hypothetical protein